MNLSLLYGSVRYLKSFKLIVSLSTYIDNQITSLVYDDDKLTKAFKLKDSIIIRAIIHLNNNINLLHTQIMNHINNFDILEAILDHDPSLIHYRDDFILRMHCKVNDLEACKKLAKYNPNVRVSDSYCFKIACNELKNAELLKWLFEQLAEGESIDTDMFYTETSICADRFNVMKVIMDHNKKYIPSIEAICFIKELDEAYKMLTYVLDRHVVTESDISDAFRAACGVGNYAIVKFMLDKYGTDFIQMLPEA